MRAPEKTPSLIDTLCLVLRRNRDTRSFRWSREEWVELAEVAEAEGVAPLLYSRFDTGGWPPGAPLPVQRSLRRAYFNTAGTNLTLYEELARVLPALEALTRKRGRPAALVLKGVDLATSLYANIALRPATDLDLLFPQEAMQESFEVLAGLGYREVGAEMAPGLKRLARQATKLTGGLHQVIVLDFHWSLVSGTTDRRAPALDWFWEQSESYETPDGDSMRFFHLSSTANLLYLAAHMILQHGASESRLIWLYDIHLLASSSSVNWEQVVCRAQEFRWAGAMRTALEVSRKRFDTPFPAGVMRELEERRDATSDRTVKRLAHPIHTRALTTWNEWSNLDGRGRLLLLWGIVLPTPAYVRWRYQPRPHWLWPLCYPYRWWLIVWEGLGTLVKLGWRKLAGNFRAGSTGRHHC